MVKAFARKGFMYSGYHGLHIPRLAVGPQSHKVHDPACLCMAQLHPN